MTPTANPSRLQAIQVMRGIAAMLVVLDHGINSNDFRIDLPRSWLGSGHFNDFGASGVDLFFVVSGFVMAHVMSGPSARSAGHFLLDRFIRIVPAFLMASLAFLAVTMATGRIYGVEPLANNLTIFPLYDPSTFVPPALIVGWTLAFELAFYSVVCLAIWASRDPARRTRLTAQAVGLLAIVGLITAPRTDLLAIWANPIWLEFLLGIFVHWLWKRRRREVSFVTCVALMLGGLAGLSLSLIFGFPFEPAHTAILDGDAGLLRPIWWAFPYATILLGTLWLSQRTPALGKSRTWRALVAVGDASYSLYLVHLTVIFPWEDLAPTNSINPDVVIMVQLGLSVIVALACYRFCEAPLLRWLRQKVSRRPGAVPVQVPAIEPASI